MSGLLVFACGVAVVVGLVSAWSAWFWGRCRQHLLSVKPMGGALVSGTVALALALALAVGWSLSSPSLIVSAPLLVSIAMVEHRRRGNDKRQLEFDIQLPLLVETILQQLQSGMGLHGVCSRPPSVGIEVDEILSPMVAALAAGFPLAVAVEQIGHPVEDRQHHARVRTGNGNQPQQGTRLLATALAVLAARGGPSVPALQRLRLALTGVAQARLEARSRSAQALASARLLALAPALFAAMLATFDNDIAHLYLRRPVGAVCIVLCIALTYSGWSWMNRVVKQTVPSTVVDASI